MKSPEGSSSMNSSTPGKGYLSSVKVLGGVATLGRSVGKGSVDIIELSYTISLGGALVPETTYLITYSYILLM